MEPVIAQQWSLFGFLSDTTLRADSLPGGVMPMLRAESSQEIFSLSSTLTHQNVPPLPALEFMPAMSWGVAVWIVVTLALYCWVVYRYSKQIRASVKALFSFEDTFFIFENLTLDFKHFFRYSRYLILLSISLVAVMTISESLTEGVMDMIIVIGGILYLFISLFIQKISVGLVSLFSSTPGALRSTLTLSTFNWSVISILFCPISIVMISIPGLWPLAWYLLAATAFAHSIRLFIYFKLTGFSILQWFLYLCTLEAVPFTIIGGIVLRLNIL